jgi:hypothetical protein
LCSKCSSSSDPTSGWWGPHPQQQAACTNGVTVDVSSGDEDIFHPEGSAVRDTLTGDDVLARLMVNGSRMKTAKRYATKAMFKSANETAEKTLFDNLKEETIQSTKDGLFEARSKREMDYVRKEFELAIEFGSRISRWNLLWDKVNDRMVYVDVDTLQIISGKSAICEFCDTVFAPPDIKCKKCDRKRSGKNQKLYRL